MKVGIIGAGFSGLAAAVDLVDKGIEVMIWEKEKSVGGLGGGFKEKGWKWSLDRYYHHIFSGDKEVIGMANKVGAGLMWGLPKSNSWIDDKEWQLDSPVSVLKFQPMGLWGRLRMGTGLAILKIIVNGEWLEKYKVVNVLPWLIGKEGYEKIWERMLMAKFGKYIDRVSMSWFWARVAKRTQKLGYFKKGFENLAEKMADYVKNLKGEIRLGEGVEKVEKSGKGWKINGEKVDAVLVTTPAPVAKKWWKEIRIPKIDYLWGQTLILEMDKSVIDGYWLNVLEKEWPFLVLVEQTNFINKKYYGDKYIVYLGNYLENDDKKLKMSNNELLDLYLPYIKKINPKFKKTWIKRKWRFQNNYAQPVFPVNYSKQLPNIKTKTPGVYMANMNMVYPWDRGVNYAVELGRKAANIILESS